MALRSDFAACPHCKTVFEKSPQLKLMSQSEHMLYLGRPSQPCRVCKGSLSVERMVKGEYDVNRGNNAGCGAAALVALALALVHFLA